LDGPEIAYSMYCSRHPECISWTAWGEPLAVSIVDREGLCRVPKDLLARLAAHKRTDEPEAGPVERLWIARASSILAAMLDRHKGCELWVVTDYFDERGGPYRDFLDRREEALRAASALPAQWAGPLGLEDDVQLCVFVDQLATERAVKDAEFDAAINEARRASTPPWLFGRRAGAAKAAAEARAKLPQLLRAAREAEHRRPGPANVDLVELLRALRPVPL
jgi:hypothetical protein